MHEHPEPTTALGSGLGGLVAAAAEQSAADLICELTLLQVLHLRIEVLAARADASQNSPFDRNCHLMGTNAS